MDDGYNDSRQQKEQDEQRHYEEHEMTLGVIARMAKVSAEISQVGVKKNKKNEQQGYAFRGVDDAMNALSPLLAKYELICIPSHGDRTVTERTTRSGSALFYVTVQSHFTIYAPDGSCITGCAVGEAMDSGDKATNKAMAAAYKYFLLQAFCVPTEGMKDADFETHEVEYKSPLSKKAAAVDHNKIMTSIISIRDAFEEGSEDEARKVWASLSRDEKEFAWRCPPFTEEARNSRRQSEFKTEEHAFIRALHSPMETN